METGKLYRVNGPNRAMTMGILLKGVTADVTVYGSQSKPAELSDMVNIAGEVITESGAYPFVLLPEYIALSGTFTAAEIVGGSVEELSDIL